MWQMHFDIDTRVVSIIANGTNGMKHNRKIGNTIKWLLPL